MILIHHEVLSLRSLFLQSLHKHLSAVVILVATHISETQL